MKEESNSSSLISFEEKAYISQSKNLKKEKNEKSLNEFINKENENNNNNNNNINQSFKPSFTSVLYKQSFKNSIENDNQNYEYTNKIFKGEMTPSLTNNKSFFQSKFGKSPYNEEKKEKNNQRKSCRFIFPINNTSSKNYYIILKEVNKLIKYISNAQEIFSKKTIKLNLNNNEKKFNLILKSINKTKQLKKSKTNKKKSKIILSETDKVNINENDIQNIFNNNEINDSFLENEFQETEINIIELIIEIFKKPSGIRNKDELYFIEHYLMTFENVMKIMQQKKIGSAGNDLAKKIARYMQLDIIPKNTVICKLGDDGDKFYVIFQGNVAVLIPKETNAKMDINEYLEHLKKLFSIGEYELALKTIESNLHIYKNRDIIYLKSDIEKNLYMPEYFNYQRENLSIKEYLSRIEYNQNKKYNENKDLNNHNEHSNNDNFELNINSNNKTIFNFKEQHSPRQNIHIEEKSFLGRNIKQINLINKNPQKKSTSLTRDKLLEFKSIYSLNKDIKNKNEFSDINPYKKSIITAVALKTYKNEDFDINNNFGKNIRNNFLNQRTVTNKNNAEDIDFIIKSKIRTATSKLTKKALFINNPSHKTNNNNNDENNENGLYKKNDVIIWSYFHVTNLIDGQIFGDVALSEENKRRTATIIAQEDTICGTLDNYIYNKFIKDSQKKIRKNIVHALLNVNFLRGINAEFFEEHYFNMFKYENIQRNNYLFKSGDERNSLYIVFSGEIEVNIKCTIQQLNKILKLKKVSLDKAIVYENRLCELNEFFNRFYNNSQNIYRIKIHSFGSCIGLDEYIIRKSENGQSHNNCKDIFYVDTKCVSDKAELYSIDYKLLFNIFKTEKMEKKFHKILKNSENQTLLRIIEIKKNAILERFENLCDNIFLENYININNNTIEKKDSEGDYKLHNSEKKEKRQKNFKIVINDIHSNFINNINTKKILKKKSSSIKNDKIKKLKIKSNSSSKTSKIIFEDILDDFEKEKPIEVDKNYIKNKIITINNKFDDKDSKYSEKISSIDDLVLELNNNPLKSNSKIKKDKNVYASNKNNNKQIIKFNKIKEIQFEPKDISSINKSKNNILNKYNKNIILYPILLKKTKQKIANLLGSSQQKKKIFKKSYTEENLMKPKKKQIEKLRNSIFSLVINGLPHFNNKLINDNIREYTKICDSFKNAQLIDKNLLKIPKEKSFFYKGCESLLTIENNKNNTNIPIIDLLKYDEIYEKKFGIKRNHSAINQLSKKLYKL